MKIATDMIRERLESMRKQVAELRKSTILLRERIESERLHEEALNSQIRELEEAIKTLEG